MSNFFDVPEDELDAAVKLASNPEFQKSVMEALDRTNKAAQEVVNRRQREIDNKCPQPTGEEK